MSLPWFSSAQQAPAQKMATTSAICFQQRQTLAKIKPTINFFNWIKIDITFKLFVILATNSVVWARRFSTANKHLPVFIYMYVRYFCYAMKWPAWEIQDNKWKEVCCLVGKKFECAMSPLSYPPKETTCWDFYKCISSWWNRYSCVNFKWRNRQTSLFRYRVCHVGHGR